MVHTCASAAADRLYMTYSSGYRRCSASYATCKGPSSKLAWSTLPDACTMRGSTATSSNCAAVRTERHQSALRGRVQCADMTDKPPVSQSVPWVLGHGWSQCCVTCHLIAHSAGQAWHLRLLQWHVRAGTVLDRRSNLRQGLHRSRGLLSCAFQPVLFPCQHHRCVLQRVATANSVICCKMSHVAAARGSPQQERLT